jgi:chaperonin GroES
MDFHHGHGWPGRGRPPASQRTILELSRMAQSGPAAGRKTLFPRTTVRRTHPLATATATRPVHASKSTKHAVATLMIKKLRPLGDRVVVQPSAREEMTKSGIVIPDTAKEKPQEGTILAAGPGRVLDDGKRETMDVKKGDKVLYAKYAGTEFKIDGEDLLIVSQKDILAIVERRP